MLLIRITFVHVFFFLLSYDLLQAVFLIDKDDYWLSCQSTLDKNQINQNIDIDYVCYEFSCFDLVLNLCVFCSRKYQNLFLDLKIKWNFSRFFNLWKIMKFSEALQIHYINITTKCWNQLDHLIAFKNAQKFDSSHGKRKCQFLVFFTPKLHLLIWKHHG